MSWFGFDLKNAALLGIGVGVIVAVLAIGAEHPTPMVAGLRILGPAVAIASFFLLIGLHLRRDLAPDYLSLCRGDFFERDGFCFGVSLECEESMAVFTIMFQSRHSGPSTARIALRPAASRVITVSPEIHCGPAGFGIAKFPVAIPSKHQGKTVTFEIGADVDYPLGKEREVRFRSGRPIRHNAHFRSLVLVVQAALHCLLGHFLVHSPATIRLTLPTDVADYVPDDASGHAEVLWSLSKNDPSQLAGA